jgi:hypothetical protein
VIEGFVANCEKGRKGGRDVDCRLKFLVTLETCYSSFFLEMVLDTMVDLFWVIALQLP